MTDVSFESNNEITQGKVKSRKLLGYFIMIEACFNFLEALMRVFLRYYYSDDTFKAGTYQSVTSFVKLFFVTVAYLVIILNFRKMEYFSRNARKLLLIWGIILIPVQLIYDLSTLIYNRMLGMIWLILNTSYTQDKDVLYAMFYDSSHGFKYVGMFMAIIIGIVMTGIVIENRKFVTIGGVLTVIFMIFFAAVNMKKMSFTIFSLDIGLNFTSLLFHSLTTVGLFMLAIYIIKRYANKVYIKEKDSDRMEENSTCSKILE